MSDEGVFYENRLKFRGDLTPVIRRACSFYGVAEPVAFDLFPTGFKDYSMRVDTKSGDRWVLKIFSKETEMPEILRYEDIISYALDAGVKHPLLRMAKDGELVYSDHATDMHMSLVEFVPGKLLNQYTTIPTHLFQLVISEAVKISNFDLHPPHRFDMWQVTNLKGLYEETKHVLNPEVSRKIQDTLSSYEKVLPLLPYGFVHGDMTRTNVIERSDRPGEIALLDFGASGTYPRIHELSILAAHFLADGILSLDDCLKMVCDEFISQGGLLSEFESGAMLIYTQAILAAKYLCNVYEIDEKIETREMVYWRDISITYLMPHSGTKNPWLTGEKYRSLYRPHMWVPKP